VRSPRGRAISCAAPTLVVAHALLRAAPALLPAHGQ